MHKREQVPTDSINEESEVVFSSRPRGYPVKYKLGEEEKKEKELDLLLTRGNARQCD